MAVQSTVFDAKVMKTALATLVAVAMTATLVTTIGATPGGETTDTKPLDAQVAQKESTVTNQTTQAAPAEESTSTQPAPAATQQVAPALVGACEQYRALFERYFDWDVATAMAIAHAESSGCDTTAFNGADAHGICNGSHGIMQVACIWAGEYNIPVESLYDPATNVEIAHRIYQRRGSFYDWSTYLSGAYKEHLSLYQR